MATIGQPRPNETSGRAPAQWSALDELRRRRDTLAAHGGDTSPLYRLVTDALLLSGGNEDAAARELARLGNLFSEAEAMQIIAAEDSQNLELALVLEITGKGSMAAAEMTARYCYRLVPKGGEYRVTIPVAHLDRPQDRSNACTSLMHAMMDLEQGSIFAGKLKAGPDAAKRESIGRAWATSFMRSKEKREALAQAQGTVGAEALAKVEAARGVAPVVVPDISPAEREVARAKSAKLEAAAARSTKAPR